MYVYLNTYFFIYLFIDWFIYLSIIFWKYLYLCIYLEKEGTPESQVPTPVTHGTSKQDAAELCLWSHVFQNGDCYPPLPPGNQKCSAGNFSICIDVFAMYFMEHPLFMVHFPSYKPPFIDGFPIQTTIYGGFQLPLTLHDLHAEDISSVLVAHLQQMQLHVSRPDTSPMVIND